MLCTFDEKEEGGDADGSISPAGKLGFWGCGGVGKWGRLSPTKKMGVGCWVASKCPLKCERVWPSQMSRPCGGPFPRPWRRKPDSDLGPECVSADQNMDRGANGPPRWGRVLSVSARTDRAGPNASPCWSCPTSCYSWNSLDFRLENWTFASSFFAQKRVNFIEP